MEYSERLKRLYNRWDPRGVFISDRRVYESRGVLCEPAGESKSTLMRAHWVCDLAMHPVLEQPIPSAFRVCSFMPVTGLLSLGMLSTKAMLPTVFVHWLYQSHSAAVRYCNYADTSQPLDAHRMLAAYTASTGVAWAVALASTALIRRSPSLGAIGLVAPHSAVAAAGMMSTIMNAEAELRDGVPVIDAHGTEIGHSRTAAFMTIGRAVLLHSIIVPSCALLFPVAAMRWFVAPRLANRPSWRWPSAAALVTAGVGVLTPVAGACVPPAVSIDFDSLEPELHQRYHCSDRPQQLCSARPLY